MHRFILDRPAGRRDADERALMARVERLLRALLAPPAATSGDTEGGVGTGWLNDPAALPFYEAVVRAILRAGAYELAFRKDVPARAVISEYVAVARAFYDGEEIGMVNAVLDRMAREFRADEFDAPAA